MRAPARERGGKPGAGMAEVHGSLARGSGVQLDTTWADAGMHLLARRGALFARRPRVQFEPCLCMCMFACARALEGSGMPAKGFALEAALPVPWLPSPCPFGRPVLGRVLW